MGAMNFTDTLNALPADASTPVAFSIGADWAQGRTVFGGLQTALAVRGLMGLAPDEAPLRALQVTFIAPLPVGEALTLEAQVLRQGRSATHGEARLRTARGESACLVVGVFGRPRASQLQWATPMPAADDRDAIEPPFIPGVSPSFVQHFRTRWAAGCLPLSGAARPVSRVWAAHRDLGPLTICHLVALADVIPTPALSTLTTQAMASSLTWSLDVLDSDVTFAPDALWRIDAEATDAADGYISQSATLYNPAGRAAAHARQTVTVFA